MMLMSNFQKDIQENKEEICLREDKFWTEHNSKLSVEELVDKLNEIAETDAAVTIESTGTISMPMTYYSRNDEHDWEARITERENKRTGLWDVEFEICDHNQEVSDFSCNLFEIDKITHYEGSGYFLIEFKEDNVNIIITYYDYWFENQFDERI